MCSALGGDASKEGDSMLSYDTKEWGWKWFVYIRREKIGKFSLYIRRSSCALSTSEASEFSAFPRVYQSTRIFYQSDFSYVLLRDAFHSLFFSLVKSRDSLKKLFSLSREHFKKICCTTWPWAMLLTLNSFSLLACTWKMCGKF